MTQIEIPVTLSGAIVTAEDATARNFINLVTDIDPVQDLHGYDSPWPAGGGKNLYPNSAISGTQNGLTVSQSGDKYTLSASNQSGYAQFISTDSFILSAGTYTISLFGGTNTNIAFQIRSTDGLTTYGSATLGNHATFTLSADTEVKPRITSNVTGAVSYTVTAQIESGSSDTSYTPYSNVCPISGHSNAVVTRTGKNLNPNSGVSYSTYNCQPIFLKKGNYIVSTDTGEPIELGKSIYIQLKDASGNIITKNNFSGDGWTLNGSQEFYYFTNLVTSEAPFELLTDGFFYIGFNAGEPTTNITALQLELGSSASAYESPHVQTVTVSLGNTYYGGVLDVPNGKLTVDRGFTVFNGTENWYNSWGNGHNRPNRGLSGVKQISANNVVANIISNYYPAKTANETYLGIVGISLQAGGETLYIFDPNFDYENSANDYQTWLTTHNLQVCFELATPVSVSLTPAQVQALVGTNNVWSDTGNTLLTYYRSVEMALSTMYPAKNGSPKTTLSADITASATSMALDDTSVLPPAPNLAVLGEESSAEIILYNDITGNVVSGMVRGINGTTASAWNSGTAVARNYTSYDHDTIINNILSLDEDKANVADEIMYFSSQACSAVTNAEIFRITNDAVTTDTVVLECTFSKPSAITSNLSWQSYSGYIAFTGTCTDGTCTANVTLGLKGN